MCQTLKNNGITPITLAATDAWIPAQFVLQTANGIGGLELYNGITNGTKKWNEISQIEAALDVQDMIKKGYFQDGMLGMTAEESQSKMKQGFLLFLSYSIIVKHPVNRGFSKYSCSIFL